MKNRLTHFCVYLAVCTLFLCLVGGRCEDDATTGYVDRDRKGTADSNHRGASHIPKLEEPGSVVPEPTSGLLLGLGLGIVGLYLRKETP